MNQLKFNHIFAIFFILPDIKHPQKKKIKRNKEMKRVNILRKSKTYVKELK